MKKLIAICALVTMILAVSSPALATSVALTPDTLNVAQGSQVNVSVDMSVSPGFTLTSFDILIAYDPAVFTYVATPDDTVNQGSLLTHYFYIAANGSNPLEPGVLRTSGFDYGYDPVTFDIYPTYGADLANGASGTLFTFTLLAKTDAPLGPSAITFFREAGKGVYNDVDGIVPVTDIAGSINVVPEPATMCLLVLGAMALRRRK